MYDLPKSLIINEKEYDIRTDYRVVLDIFSAFNDNMLSETEKWLIALEILFIDYETINDYESAMKQVSWFLNCGMNMGNRKDEKVFDWNKDFQFIVAPINKAFGKDIRAEEYMHWWTFMGYFLEIGECSFSNIISIRNKIKKGKKLEKYEQDFVNDNQDLINMPSDNEALNILKKLRGEEVNSGE